MVLTLQADGNTGCDPVTDNMTLTIDAAPTAEAGDNATVCEGDDLDLSASGTVDATNFSSLSWSSSGDGTFDDNTILEPIYTPSAADITNGSVVLTLQANGNGICDSVTDNMTLNITLAPIADAGSDENICEATAYDLATSTTPPSASNFSSLSWSTSGDGSFDDNTELVPVYTPGTADATNGTVTLTLEATGNGSCDPVTSDVVMTIIPEPTADAGSDEEICSSDVFDMNDFTTAPTVSDNDGLDWSTSGTGSFGDATQLITTYTPSNDDITAGSVTLTLTAFGNENCADSTDQMTLTITAEPTSEAGDDATVCEGDDLDLSASGTVNATNFSSLKWSTSGDGSFDDDTILEPIYTPSAADITNGSVVLTLQANGNGVCDPVTDNMTLTISPAPTVDAGINSEVCSNEVFDFAGLDPGDQPTANDVDSIRWESDGDGSFGDIRTLLTTYTPDSGDSSAGFATLRLIGIGASSCDRDTSEMTLTISPASLAYAGSDTTLCDAVSYDLADLDSIPNAENGAIQWTSSGNGSFDDDTIEEPTYTFGSADSTAGSVKLYMEVTGTGSCANSIDSVQFNLQYSPQVEAGTDATICSTDTLDISTLNPSASGFDSLRWTTTGNGIFADSSALNTTYVPGTADSISGSVYLKLTAYGCDSIADSLQLTVNPANLAFAGSDTTLCDADSINLADLDSIPRAENGTIQWTTSGNGTFDNANAELPTYAFGSDDSIAGSVKLYLEVTGTGSCANSIDSVQFNLQYSPQVDAGTDATICSTDTLDISSLNPSASGFDSLRWTTTGNGVFADSSALTTTYVPGTTDSINGSVYLKLTAYGCDSSADSLLLTVDPASLAFAGSDTTLCDADSINLADLDSIPRAENGTIQWTSSGNGSFDDDTIEEPTYTFGSADSTAGSVKLYMEVTGIGSCANSIDSVQFNLQYSPQVVAGTDATICSTDTLDISSLNPSASGFDSLRWTTSGNGIFADSSALTTTYVPGTTDSIDGSVYLKLTTYGCDSSADSLLLTVDPASLAFAGSDTTLCDADSINLADLDSIPRAENGTIQWTTSGNGTFDNANAELPTYAFGSDDSIAGSVKLYLEVTGIGSCANSLDSVQFNLGSGPVFNSPLEDAEICYGDTLNITTDVDGYNSLMWSTDPAGGDFIDPTVADAQYVPSSADSLAGSVDLILTLEGGGSCNNVSDTLTLTINSIEIEMLSLSNTSGCGATDGSIDIDVNSNGAGPLSYIWTGPNSFSSTDEDISNLEAGNYDVQVTDSTTGCIATASYEIEDPVPFTIDLVDVIGQTECEVDNGFVEIEVNDGTGPFDYYIEDQDGNEIDRVDDEADSVYSYDALAPGDYQLFVEDGECKDNISFTIQPVEEISASLDNSTLANCGNQDGEITVNVDQVNDNNFDVVLFDNDGNELSSDLDQDGTDLEFIFDGLAQGTYIVMVTDLVTNCEFSDEVTVNEAADFSIDDIQVVNISDCENPNGSIELSIDNPNNAELTYTWVDADGNTVNEGEEESFLNITEPGVFDVTITDGTCTISETNIEITQPAECDYDCEDFKVSPITEAATCLGVDDGKLFFLLRNVNASSPELNFDIKQAGTADSLYNRFTVDNIGQGLIVEIDSSFATGTYTVVASDPNLDCVSDTFNINIGTKTTLTASIDIEQPTCTIASGSISANVSGTNDEFEYILYFDGDSLTSNTSGVFAELEEGDYELEFNNQNTNACGLENQTFTIENTAVVDESAVDLNITNPECGEIFGTISASLNNLPSNYEFILVDENGDEIARNDTGTFNEVPEGTYVVQFENIEDPDVCPISDRGGLVIENNGSFTAEASDVENIVCHGDSTGTAVITLEGISSAFYSYDNGENWTEFTSGNRITELPAVNNLLVSDQAGTSDCELSVAVGIEYLNDAFVLDGSITLETPASCTTTETEGEIHVPEVLGGVEPYKYFVDGTEVQLSDERIISGLSREASELLIEDATGCSITREIRSIVSPNEIIFDVDELNPENNCINEPEGVELYIDPITIENVAAPYVFIINEEGESENTEFEINPADPNDNVFEVGAGKPLQYIFEKGVRYNYTLISLNNEEACSRNISRFINGGAIIPTFELEGIDAACNDGSGALRLFNIVGDTEIPVEYQIFEGNASTPTVTITENSIPVSREFFIDPNNYGSAMGFESGGYNVRIVQRPDNCEDDIESEIKNAQIQQPSGNLVVELVPEPNLPPGVERSLDDMNPRPATRKDKADGSISVRIANESGAERYFALLSLADGGRVSGAAPYIFEEDTVELIPGESYTFEDLSAGTYIIEYFDSFGRCTESLRIVQDKEGASDGIYVGFDERPFIPNVFTPNNDGKNDYFKILNLPDSDAELIVTNRNGTIVYENDSYGPEDREINLWDGGDNPDGIYFYRLKVNGNVQTGWVEIIRGQR
ncbi:MAG: gliding motility-associated C-terminal domain-containing protein [Bacteroidota bacterium]